MHNDRYDFMNNKNKIEENINVKQNS